MGSRQQAESNRNTAKIMKERKITRKQGRCGLCDKMVPLPMDNHYVGGVCTTRRKK